MVCKSALEEMFWMNCWKLQTIKNQIKTSKKYEMIGYAGVKYESNVVNKVMTKATTKRKYKIIRNARLNLG